MKIETERLILREMVPEDYDALYRVLADSDIMQHYPYTFDEKRVRSWIERNIERYRIYGFGLWALCLKDTEEIIGDCGLTMQNINGSIKPEIGYHIRRDMQRKGYAKEAASAVRDWTFENTPFSQVFTYMKKTNSPSSATAKSIGMTLVEEYVDNNNEITSVYAVSKTEGCKTEQNCCQESVMNFRISANVTEKDIEEIRGELRQFNLSKREPSEVIPLGVFYEDLNGKKKAGLTADTFGNWLCIKYLWVSEELRGQGIGSKLLKSAEDEAVSRGAKYVFVDTFDFQAPEFYKKFGYEEVFKLFDYPYSGSRYYYIKRIS